MMVYIVIRYLIEIIRDIISLKTASLKKEKIFKVTLYKLGI